MSKTVLKEQLVHLKKCFPDCKSKLSKDTVDKPFPIAIIFAALLPSQYNYDVEELKVQLNINSIHKSDINLSIINKDLPNILKSNIKEEILKNWTALIEKLNTWALVEILTWISENVFYLITSCPDFIIMYMGEDSKGFSTRRYEIYDANENVVEEKAITEAEVETDEQRDARLERLYQQEEEAIFARAREAEELKALALAGKLDPSYVKPQVLSKKEKEAQAAAKNKQGVRMSKTASRKKKFDPDAPKK